MLMRLARQTYVRQYGEFTYLFGKVTAFDQVFRSAGPFFAHITRQPKERDAIIDEIVHDYADIDYDTIWDILRNDIPDEYAKVKVLAATLPPEPTEPPPNMEEFL